MLRALRTLGRPLLGVLTCGAACGAFAAGSAQADIAWAPCGNSNELACGHLTVPLSWGGATPGVLTLAMHRHRAPVGDERSAVIALAGGPGQPALPFTEQFIRLLGPIIATRDLIVFDQRGIGLSHPLSCHRFERALIHGPPGPAMASAALSSDRRGRTTRPTKPSPTSRRSARRAATKSSCSTEPPTGRRWPSATRRATPATSKLSCSTRSSRRTGPNRSTARRSKRCPGILHDLCAHRSCAHITRSPVEDLARVVAHANADRCAGGSSTVTDAPTG